MFRLAALLSVAATFLVSLAARNQPPASSQSPPPSRALPQVTQEFISVDSPVVVLQHVRVIDGTGAAAVTDQSVVIEGGVIKVVRPANGRLAALKGLRYFQFCNSLSAVSA